MLTPRFSLSQNESHITIEIEAPFAHIKETEVFMEGNLFTFYSSPYYLRLHFSGCITEDETASAKYDGDKMKFIVAAPKVVCGEHFANLDMLTALLTPKGSCNVEKRIEECHSSGSDSENDFDIDWLLKQELPEAQELTSGYHYGFANQHFGVFSKLQDELGEVIDVQNPDDKSAQQRSSEREVAEVADFDENHYLADTMEQDEVVGSLLENRAEEIIGDDALTKEQKDLMIDLKLKKYKLNPEEVKQACLALVDILFAYCYEKRTTGGECTVESGWSISKLSSSLSWLENHENISKTVSASVRRSLCYPLYRNFNLAISVLGDAKWLLKQGRKQILKALLEIHCLMVESEPRYILNQLYIDDMCIWIQQVDDSIIHSLSDSLNSLIVDKASIGLDLAELEDAANLVLQESDTAEVASSIQQLALDSDDSDSETDSDDDSESSSSSSASESNEEEKEEG